MRSAKDHQNRPPKNPGGEEPNRPDQGVGDALRQAYDEALKESIPDDLLDLLKKLD